MFRFMQCTPEAGDCTCGYKVMLEKNYTVKDFINTVLKEFPNEHGHIGINDGKAIFGKPNCKYFRGKLTSTLPDDVLEKTIISAEAGGGWGRMDYLLCIDA